MSDDEADPDLLQLLRESLGLGLGSSTAPPDTKVLRHAEYVCDNSIDVAISSSGAKAAAKTIWRVMQEKTYSTETWSEHELHPKTKDEDTVNFIFTMNLLNFSFWSKLPSDQRFCIEYKDQRWTGYWSLIAALQRALDEGQPHFPLEANVAKSLTGIPITSSDFWQDENECPDSVFHHVFRSATEEPMPMLSERIQCLREAGRILYTDFSCSFANCISQAEHSAPRLVNSLVEHFHCFHDTTTFHTKPIHLYKRAQILVADLWACFNGSSFGEFHDIDKLTMFADYRIPQMLHALGALIYSPRLEGRIRRLEEIQPGENHEIEIRGCSIWCVELIRRQIVREHPEAEGKVNAVLIDFFLYDTCKEQEKSGKEADMLPHHRTRSIWY